MLNHASVSVIKFLAILVFCPTVLFSEGASEEHLCAPPDYRTDHRPDSSGPPTEVTLGVFLIDLLDVNDVSQTLTIDLAISMSWSDPRLAKLDGCQLSIDSIWFPKFSLWNSVSGRIFERWPQTVSIEEGGRVTYLQRSSGTFSSYHQLTNFPLDSQKFRLKFFPLKWSADDVVLVKNEMFSGISEVLSVSDWRVTGTNATLIEENMKALREVHAGYELEISAKRYVGFYFWKIFVPIALIVFMSWSVFWIDPKEFGTQIGLSATSVLTMTAFIFATTNMLPRLGHFTLLDKYIAFSTVLVFVAMLQSLVTGFLMSKGNAKTAYNLDLTCRVAFPVLFVIFCAALYNGVVK
jgi:hypothetical protein